MTRAERQRIESKVEEHNSKPDIDRLVREGGGEHFSFTFVDDDSDVILRSAVKLPSGLKGPRIDDFIHVAETWLGLLSEVRRELDDGNWKVTLDDEVVPWREDEQEYDVPL